MEFRDMYTSLLPKAAKWNSLGILLCLSPDELDIIKANSENVEECLRKVLQKWYQAQNPTTAWQEITHALRDMGEKALAKKLEAEKRPESVKKGNDHC